MEVINLVMDIICGIYKIENRVNHKIYIGQSVDIYTRWYNHKHSLRNGIHYNKHLQKSWDKYGEENFEFFKKLCYEKLNVVNNNDEERSE